MTEPTEPTVTAHTRPDEDVVLFRARGTGSAWHVDRQCPTLTRASGVVTWELTFADASVHRVNGALCRPCPRCALKVAMDAAVHAGAASPDRAAWVVLGCGTNRGALAGVHAGCSRCAALAAFAARHDLPSYATRAGYRLVGARLHTDLLQALRFHHALYRVPPQVPAIHAELLEVAWQLLEESTALEIESWPASRISEHSFLLSPPRPDALRFEAADAITTPPPGAGTRLPQPTPAAH